MVELRQNEILILETLDRYWKRAYIWLTIDRIMEETKLPDSAVMRAGLTLQENGLIKIQARPTTLIELTDEGQEYANKGLPERRLVDILESLNGKATLADIEKSSKLEPKLIEIALGWAIRKKWVSFDKKTQTVRFLQKTWAEKDEMLLTEMSGKGLVSLLSIDNLEAVETLKKRQLLKVKEKTERVFEITEDGRKAISKREVTSVKIMPSTRPVTQLTPELIITGKWHTTKLQKYNIEAPVAKTWPGKKHPYLQFLDEVRAKLVNLGFQEMTGTSVETSFFNFDALYTPQDHPARETSDIYYVKDPQYGDISQHATTVQHVAETHENGWKTGSTGWEYKYSLLTAQRLILRGHGTCLSARTLESKNLEIPSKHFSIARVYRPEITDKTHLSEFNQVEGIIIDENLTLKDLLGVLGKFAMEIAGADKVCFKPDYFPFTEPSVELSAYKEGYGWVEFGGSGIFRPEVTLPLGVKEPVIAWGLGVDRLFMMRAGIDDIRMIFSQDLDWLRRKQVT